MKDACKSWFSSIIMFKIWENLGCQQEPFHLKESASLSMCENDFRTFAQFTFFFHEYKQNMENHLPFLPTMIVQWTSN